MGSFGKNSFFCNDRFAPVAIPPQPLLNPGPQPGFLSDSERLFHYFLQSAMALSATAKAFLTPILAQRAKPPQRMVTLIFKARLPRKHWPKRVSDAQLSSMFY
jgi:hypothetical protein